MVLAKLAGGGSSECSVCGSAAVVVEGAAQHLLVHQSDAGRGLSLHRVDPSINSGDSGTVLLDEGVRLFGGVPQLNPEVHPLLGEKVVGAAVSPRRRAPCLVAFLS